MEKGPIRFEVESLDIEGSTVTRLHENRNSSLATFLANEDLYIEGITFFDDEIQAVEEFIDVLDCHAVHMYDGGEIGIDLGNASSGDHGLVVVNIHEGRRNSIHIREFEIVEIGKT